jgi:hypothetical protein
VVASCSADRLLAYRMGHCNKEPAQCSYFRSQQFDAKPSQSRQSSESHFEMDGYILWTLGLLAMGGVAKA